MRFDKKFQKGRLMRGSYREYFDFLQSLDIEFDDEVFISKILKRKNVEYLEKGGLYLGIGKLEGKKPNTEIILYVNPIEWRLPQEDASIGILRVDRKKFLKGDWEFMNGNYRSVGKERGCLKEYQGKTNGEPSFYLTNFDLYPLSVAVGIINWMW